METAMEKKNPPHVKGPGIKIRIPVGEMEYSDNESIRIKLDKHYSKPGQIKAHLQALKRLDSSRYLLPNLQEIKMKEGRLYLSYPQVLHKRIPFTDILSTWQKNPQIQIPVFLHLAKFLVSCSQQLRQAGIALLPFSPLFLFYTLCSYGPWHLILLPVSDIKIGDWAQADPLSWQWISSKTLLEGSLTTESILYASILHFCLSGDLFPELLTRQEKFKHLLKGWTKPRPAFYITLSDALPISLDEERKNFEKVTENLLNPNHSIHSDKELFQTCIETLEKDFSIYRLASRWEYEHKTDVALELLLNYSDFAGQESIPWRMVARLKEQDGDWEGGLDARLKALKFDEDDAVRNSICCLFRIATLEAVTGGHSFFVEAFNKVNSALCRPLEEFHALQMAHLESRYLREYDKAQERLRKDFSDPWNQLLRLMIRARILCIQEEYPAVSSLCKQGVRIINKLHNQGLNKGRYVLSYLQILDGIAHFGAVGRLSDVSYLINAFDCFTAALDVALGIDADDLIENGVHWLIFLENHAALFPPNICLTLTAGIDVYLRAKIATGFEIPVKFDKIPSIPWYDENLLFPSLSIQGINGG
jgi:hypothetical protein